MTEKVQILGEKLLKTNGHISLRLTDLIYEKGRGHCPCFNKGGHLHDLQEMAEEHVPGSWAQLVLY